MDLNKSLSDLGYTESEIESITTKKKIYFQADVDNIVSKKEANLKEKFERNSVSKSDYDLLKSEYNNIVKETKTSAIREIYNSYGGKEGKVFEDFMKLNADLYDVESDKLKDAFKGRANDYNWAFATSKETINNANMNFDVNDADIFKELSDASKDNDYFEGTIYKIRK